MPKNKLTGYDFKNLYPYKKILSSSQMLSYEEDPSRFWIEYFLGAKREPSKPMLTGSIFSELHNHRDFDFRSALATMGVPARIGDLFAEVIRAFPVIPSEIPLKCKYNGWILRATLDGASGETIIENKTGQMEWDQSRTDSSDQITFQSFVYWKKNKKVPKVIILNWVDTRSKTTKKLQTFKTKRTISQLKEFEKRVDYVLKNIDAENFTNQLY